jgi:hypothetical protein
MDPMSFTWRSSTAERGKSFGLGSSVLVKDWVYYFERPNSEVGNGLLAHEVVEVAFAELCLVRVRV